LARTASPTSRSRTSPNIGPYKCPECEKKGIERRFPTPQARGRHRQAMHGVVGSSPAAVIARSKKGANTSATVTKRVSKRGNTRITRRKAGTVTRRKYTRRQSTGNGQGSTFDQNKLLSLIFPNGLPAKASVIADVQDLIQKAEKLHREGSKAK
jgi:hypothetical protein